MRTARTLGGIGVWLGILLALGWWAEHRLAAVEGTDADPSSPGALKNPAAQQLWQYVADRPEAVELEMDRPLYLGVGDPIFAFDAGGNAVRVGEVTRVSGPEKEADLRWTQATGGEAIFYPQVPPLSSGARLDYYATPESLEWVAETLLPPAKRRQIAQEMSAAFEQHHEEILRELRPIVEQGFRDALAVVEQDLPQIIERHRPELTKLGEKYRGEVVEKRLTPLVRKEIWPIVQRRAEPLAEKIGEEVWNRASLWRFGWRYAYDVSPLPQKNMVEKEWKRFLHDDAMPILESHTDEIIRLQQQVLSDIARNERVRQVVRESLIDVLDDPQAQHVAWVIVKEAIVQNPRLRETLERRWRSEEARQAMTIAADRLEPTVRLIGDMLIGTRETGISPEFARVLRNQILGKDRRWLVLTTPDAIPGAPADGEQSALHVHRGSPETFRVPIEAATLKRREPLLPRVTDVKTRA